MEPYSGLNLILDFIVIAILLAGIWLFGSPRTAKFGNLAAAFALACAAGLVLARSGSQYPWLLIICLLAGAVPGVVVARKIGMIQIPAMVAFQHGAGGVAAFFLSLAELMRGGGHLGLLNEISGLLGMAMGALTFSGSLMAAGKLSNKLNQKPVVLQHHNLVTLVNLLVMAGLIIAALVVPESPRLALYIFIILTSALFGIIFSMRIGGADMPVLISFLNATAGVAAAFCGMIIENKLLISCGAAVAASGSILTHVMCKAMNRNLLNIFIPGIRTAPASPPSGGSKKAAEDRPGPAGKEDGDRFQKAADAAAAAQKVIVIPGYGMAVAQAQFAVLEFMEKLAAMGKEVKFAIHPVAGRMPGHMNVLLAEAGIDYDMLFEMDEINHEFKETDFTMVIGACDVVNPAAIQTDNSPISGMPILLAHESKTVVCCNLDRNPGYSGVENPLYDNENTIMLSGDAKESVHTLTGRLLEMPPKTADAASTAGDLIYRLKAAN